MVVIDETTEKDTRKAEDRAEIMIIDSDQPRTERLKSVLTREGYTVCCARNGRRGFEICSKRDPELVLLGFRTPGVKDSGVLERLAAHEIGPVVLLAEPADMGELAPALRAGAHQVLPSTCEDRQLVDTVRKLARLTRETPGRRLVEHSLLGQSPALREVRRRLLALGSLSIPVLISGERGTGRRHAAGLLHDLREQSRILRVARVGEQIPEPRKHETLYVPELEALSTADQLRLLRYVERQDTSPQETGAVIAATTRDPRELGTCKAFQQALADRLSRFDISLPALRDRQCDVAELAKHIAERHARRLGRGCPQITLPALRALEGHSWPGNVTELAKLMERLVAFSVGERIDSGLTRAALSEIASPVTRSRHAQSRRERVELMELIDATGGNLAEVARRLELSRGAVIYRAQKYGLLAPRRSQRGKVGGAAGYEGTRKDDPNYAYERRRARDE